MPPAFALRASRHFGRIDVGDPHPLAFDQAVCQEWLTDRIDLLPVLLDAFVKSYETHLQARGDAAKN